MLRNILTGVAALALVAGLSAQTQYTVKQTVNVPVKYFGEYTVMTGEWSHGGGARVGTRVLYNSQSPGNYYSNVGNTSQTAPDQEWIDEGILPDTSNQLWDQINGFDFSYCSTDLEPLGNQCSVGITFYEDYIPCSTPLSAATCAYLISGLPCSISGNIECWAVSIDLMGGAECTATPGDFFATTGAVANPLGNVNGNFGWGFTPNPGAAGMNDTGPILSFPCPNPVSGCSSGSLQGNQNFFWWEDPTAVWTGCYWFGGVPWASFDMKMLAPSLCSFSYYGAGGNTLMLTSTDFFNTTGGNTTWTMTGGNPGDTYWLGISLGTANIMLANCEVLIDPFQLAGPGVVPMVPDGAGGASITLTTPPLPAQIVVYTQVFCTGDGNPPNASNITACSNGLCHS